MNAGGARASNPRVQSEASTTDRTGDDEALLVAAARAGDRAALATLLEREESRIDVLLSSTLGARHASADLAQEVRLRAVRGIAGFRGDAGFGTWVHRITMNVAISALRRLRAEAARPQPLPDEVEETRSGRSSDPARDAQRTELRERLAAAVDRLPPLMAEVFTLRHRQGLEPAQIADRLDVPAATVRTRLFHARRRLREALDDLV